MFGPANAFNKPISRDRFDRLKVAAIFITGVALVANSYLITMGKVEIEFLRIEMFDSKPKTSTLPQVEVYLPPGS
jgi:hypothetical protein